MNDKPNYLTNNHLWKLIYQNAIKIINSEPVKQSNKSVIKMEGYKIGYNDNAPTEKDRVRKIPTFMSDYAENLGLV